MYSLFSIKLNLLICILRTALNTLAVTKYWKLKQNATFPVKEAILTITKQNIGTGHSCIPSRKC